MDSTTTQHNKLSKSKGKMVKPILKKLSHSEKNSLDLDRPWEEQQVPGMGVWPSGYESAGSARPARDVSFSFNESPALPGKPRFQHGRTASGTSHISVATNGSGGGGGARSSSFVHPFQQTPRTNTPPLIYGNSAASPDTANAYNITAASSTRDYSPTITETEDDDEYPAGSLPTHRHHHSHTSISQSSMRRPSLASQRASSYSDITAAPSLRINTGRTIPSGPSMRRGPGGSSLSSSLSHSDLHLSSVGGATTTLDSPASIGTGAGSSFSTSANPTSALTGTSAGAPMSPLRSSLEGVGFPRLRSRSELDSGARADQIREARRKFEERERIKAEKHDREMLRKRERRDHKEAKEIERQAAAQLRKNSSSDGARPSLSRRATPTANTIDEDNGPSQENVRHSRRAPELSEKPMTFKSSNYDSVPGGTEPAFGAAVDTVAFKNARRSNTTKHKTQGYWTGFILWLRTRLFRMGRK